MLGQDVRVRSPPDRFCRHKHSARTHRLALNSRPGARRVRRRAEKIFWDGGRPSCCLCRQIEVVIVEPPTAARTSLKALFSIPLERQRLDALDPGVFAVAVSGDVGRMVGVDLPLEGFVLAANVRVAAQIRGESEMPLDFRAPFGKNVDVMGAGAVPVLGEEASAGDAIFAPNAISGRHQGRGLVVQ